MDPHEVRAELARSDAQELLHSPSPARLAYNGPDGLPRVSPVGFLWNGEQIVVCSATTSPKVRALTSRPDVALTIDVGNTPADAKALNIRRTRECRDRRRRPGRIHQKRPPSPWVRTVSGTSSTPSARRTSRWHASASIRSGRACTTSAPAACRRHSERWWTRLKHEPPLASKIPTDSHARPPMIRRRVPDRSLQLCSGSLPGFEEAHRQRRDDRYDDVCGRDVKHPRADQWNSEQPKVRQRALVVAAIPEGDSLVVITPAAELFAVRR